ncbi:MAG TPA: hypothetical protein VF483_11635, partial [Gemmatimonadaceae bacterium]
MSHPLPMAPGFAETSRRDAWWVQPLTFIAVIVVCFGYLTWAAFQGNHYEFGNYLSPAYSPVLWGDSAHAWFGKTPPSWLPWPSFIVFSPALLILPFPGLFRFTCYYYRGAYYKAFWADPPNCAVGEPRKSYLGENSLPLILQNLHRYALYIALVFIGILSYDVWKALWFKGADGAMHLGVGVGTLVLAVNVACIGSYTLGCHAMRHLVGGFRDEMTKSPMSQVCYN